MFKVGDRIRFKDKYCARDWYSPKTFIITFVDDSDFDNIEVILNEDYFISDHYKLNTVFIRYIEIDVQATRVAKLKRIFND